MSELKAITVYDAYWQANSVGEGTGILVYLKSEADKVIARHKYKRCLAMAKLCYDRWIRAYNSSSLQKARFYAQWQKRWEKLAEKFKEAK